MDTELVTQAQIGDKAAFAAIAAALADRYLAASHRILRDLALAEDATQQALLAIWRDLPQLRDPARFDAWSYRLLVRACYASLAVRAAGAPAFVSSNQRLVIDATHMPATSMADVAELHSILRTIRFE